jgi:uncharacterized membrane protein YgcG
MRVPPAIRLFLACSLVLAGALSCFAQRPQRTRNADFEQIYDFHSDITLQPDSTLVVTETIDVFAAGLQIRHGIYREFPTSYTDAFNNKYAVGFQMLGATLDGASEHFRVEDYSNGKRIYLGDPGLFVQRGRHVYTLTYTTNRQLGFFKDHDELFWNVTGLGWGFPIQHASATVHLPAAIPTDQVNLSGYTGPQGSREAALTTSTEDSSFQFNAARSFPPRAGLTILLTWPKGYLTEPTVSEKLAFFYSDNRDALFLTAGFLLILLYYLIAWNAVGRDPARGVIMALYQPPQSLSPAGMRYLMRMGFDNKTFAAAILDMAVRGFLTIKEQAGSYTLYLTGKDNRGLTDDEKQVANLLFSGRNQIWLHNENHQSIKDAIQTLKDWLAATEQRKYFVTNSRYLIPPIVFSAAVAAVTLLVKGGPQIFAGAFLCVWLSIWTLAVSAMVRNAFKTWKAVLHPQQSLPRQAGIGKAIFLTVFLLPFCFFEVMAFFFLMKVTSLALVIFVLASAAIHLLFLHLMKAPTFAGRRLMDQVEGFKTFLGEVDGDRLNRAAPPEQTTAAFEKFLPYALALDVEQAWADKFSSVIAGAGTDPGAHNYSPSFCSGSWNGNGFGASGFALAFSGSLTSAISSSATAPGSGSGGGGGGSGGGGGGGGGGGW